MTKTNEALSMHTVLKFENCLTAHCENNASHLWHTSTSASTPRTKAPTRDRRNWGKGNSIGYGNLPPTVLYGDEPL